MTLGGVVGLERELSGKPAGLRTNILICLGAAVITDLSMVVADSLPGHPADPGRIAAQIVTGIGFLGAGSILQTRGAIHGLTTAATIWVVAAIGMLCGAGVFVGAVGATVLVMMVLSVLGRFEEWVTVRRRVSGAIRVSRDFPTDEVREMLEDNGLRILRFEVRDTKRSKVIELRVRGSATRLRAAAEELGNRSGVLDIDLD